MAEQTPTYIDRDEQLAQQFASIISPLASQGVDPDEAFVKMMGANGGQSNAGVEARPAAPAGAVANLTRGRDVSAPNPSTDTTVPAAVTPTGTSAKASDWAPVMERDSATGELRAAKAAEDALNQIPVEDTKSAAIQALVERDSKPIQSRDAQGKVLEPYRATLGQKILRGLRGVGRGLLEGGIVGAVAGGLDPRDTLSRDDPRRPYAGYGDPNRTYEQQETQREQRLPGEVQSLSDSRKAYQEAQNALKARSQEQRALATTYKDAGTTAGTALQREETTRHNQEEEDIRRNPPNKGFTNEFESVHAEAARRFPNDPGKAYEWEHAQLMALKQAGRDTSAGDLAHALQAVEFGMNQTREINSQEEAERSRRYAELDKNPMLKYDETRMAAERQKIDAALDAKYAPVRQGVQDKVDTMLNATKSGKSMTTKKQSEPSAKDFPLKEFKGHKAGDIKYIGGKKVQIIGFNSKGQVAYQPAP